MLSDLFVQDYDVLVKLHIILHLPVKDPTRMELLQDTSEDEDSAHREVQMQPLAHAEKTGRDHLIRIEQIYQATVLPEMQLMDIENIRLKETVARMDHLQKLILQQPNDLEDSNLEQDSIALVERIGRDMALYTHFAERRTLEANAGQGLDDFDESVGGPFANQSNELGSSVIRKIQASESRATPSTSAGSILMVGMLS